MDRSCSSDCTQRSTVSHTLVQNDYCCSTDGCNRATSSTYNFELVMIGYVSVLFTSTFISYLF